MKSELQLLKEANDILRSVNSIIEKKGNITNWEGIDKKVKMALAEQHELLLAKNCYTSDVIKSVCDCGKPISSKYSPCCSISCWSDKFE